MMLIDEETSPSLRVTIGSLLQRAVRADIAVAHVRLAALDLVPGEVAALRRCRILLGRLDARELSHLGNAATHRRTHLELLRRFISAPHVEVRSGGWAAWSPDFSIYYPAEGVGADDSGDAPLADDSAATCLVGAHYFHQPLVDGGPSFTCHVTHASAVALATRRFDMLWQQAHDVSAAVLHEIERVLHEAG